MSGRLAGKVALVTGGASGLGLAVAERFLDEGARVTIVDRSSARLAAIEGRDDPRIAVVQGDVTLPETNEQAVASTLQAFGRLDALVANAGVWDFNTPLDAMTLQQLDASLEELLAVNVKAGVLAVHAALPSLRAANGSVTFTLSGASFVPGGGGVVYTASKHALVGVIRQLAFDLAPDVRVNGVAVGGMATQLSGPRALGLDQATITDAIPNFEELLQRFAPMKHAATPRDFAAAFVHLASDEAELNTGAIVDLSLVVLHGKKERELLASMMMQPSGEPDQAHASAVQ